MSRSYKKNPYYRLVCQRGTTVSKVKRMSNRKIRRKMKQGLLDYELTASPSSYKKIENWAWDYDIFTVYGGNRDDWDDQRNMTEHVLESSLKYFTKIVDKLLSLWYYVDNSERVALFSGLKYIGDVALLKECVHYGFDSYLGHM